MTTHFMPERNALAAIALCLVVSSSLAEGPDPGAEAAPQSKPHVQAASEIEAGRYLITVAGCNDCHTAGYSENGGQVAESDWLTGSPLGWRGPWGTTYASNLRLLAQSVDEDGWVAMLTHRKDRPPMPWMNVNRLSEQDMRAMYRYVRFLGARGEPTPGALAADVEPSTPYLWMIPTMPADRTADLQP
ncbi:c-type cytochrome [Lentisalinibacter salinarum]|uniref:c-type cytochrome n=1 Tax=Lentisalinibacter salinarum TaxID=2992239 RepID=UPI003868A0B1